MSSSIPRTLHRRARRKREDGHDYGALTGWPVDRDEYLIRRGRHEPELGGVELRIAGNGRGRFGRRRASPPHIPLTGANRDVIRVGPRAVDDPNGDCGAARNHSRQPDAHANVIRAGVAHEERVGAAYVSHRQHRQQGDDDARARHR